MRVPNAGGLTPDQIQAMAQLGLFKPNPPAAPVNGMTAQQQAALLSALQAGNPAAVNRAALAPPPQQQQRPGIPPGLANGAAFLNQARPQQLPAMPVPQPAMPMQQPTSQQLLAAALGQRPPSQQGPAVPAPRPPAGGLAGLMPVRPGDAQSDPIQTLQVGSSCPPCHAGTQNPAPLAGLAP